MPRILFFLVLCLGLVSPALAQTTTAISIDGTTLNVGTSGNLVTSDGTWTFSNALGSGGNMILLNGSTNTGGSAKTLEVSGGHLYALNSLGQWWEWLSGKWNTASAPVIPTPAPTPPPVVTTTFPKGCIFGVVTDATGLPTCAKTALTGPAGPQGPPGIGSDWPALPTEKVGRQIATTDHLHVIVLDATTPQTYTLPPAGAAGFQSPFKFCFTVKGAGSMNFGGAPISASPTSYGTGQHSCLGPNAENNAWIGM